MSNTDIPVELLRHAIYQCMSGAFEVVYVVYNSDNQSDSNYSIWRIAKSRHNDNALVFNRIFKKHDNYPETFTADVYVSFDRLDIINAFIIPEFVHSIEALDTQRLSLHSI